MYVTCAKHDKNIGVVKIRKVLRNHTWLSFSHPVQFLRLSLSLMPAVLCSFTVKDKSKSKTSIPGSSINALHKIVQHGTSVMILMSLTSHYIMMKYFVILLSFRKSNKIPTGACLTTWCSNPASIYTVAYLLATPLVTEFPGIPT